MRGRVLVVHNDDISDSDFVEKNQLFVEAAKKNNIDLAFKANTQLYTYLDNSSVKCHDSLGTYDYALFFDKDVWLARNLEMLGVKVVNSSKSIDLCENKANMYQELARNNIKIPKTVIFPSMSKFNRIKALQFVTDALNDLGLPVVIKKWFGESGQDVCLAKSRDEALDIIEKMGARELLLQEFIVESSGTDIRMFVIKNKVVSAIRRQGISGDFRSNVSLGGVMYNYIPTYLDEQLAINATKAVGCDFAIVDMLRSINGLVVCEVNTTANVNNFYKMSDVNVSELLLKSIK